MPDVDEARMAEAGAPPPWATTTSAPRSSRTSSRTIGPAVRTMPSRATRSRPATVPAPTSSSTIRGASAAASSPSSGTALHELRRVQWPNRRQVGQATAVVLGFVVIAGGYLGLLDALWKPLIDAIL